MCRLIGWLSPAAYLPARERSWYGGVQPGRGDRACRRGEAVILVRVETSADDMEAIRVATGVLTSRGGMTNHAVGGTGIRRPCVTGCPARGG